MPYADHIIALDNTGRIAEQGTFGQLKEAGGYVQRLATKHKGEEANPDEETLVAQTDPHDDAVAQSAVVELNRPVGDLAVYNYYFSSVGWLRTLLFLILVVMFGVSNGMTQLLLTYWTDAIAMNGNAVNTFYLGIYGLLAGISTLGLMGSAWQYLVNMLPKSAERLHRTLLQTVMSAPLSFFTKTDTGEITNRFSQDMSLVDMEIPYALIDLAISAIICIVGAVLMCLSAGYFAAAMPPVILMMWVLQKYYLRTSRQMRILDLEAKTPLYSQFIETLSGLSTIRAFGWTSNFKEKNIVLLDASQKPYYLLFCIQRWLALVLDLMVGCLAILLMIFIVKLRSGISAGYVGLALVNVMNFNESLAYIIKCWTALETSIGAISRLKSFAEQTAPENLPLEIQSVPEHWPMHGAIEFKNVSASYTANSDLVIRNLNMAVKSGEKIGICGRSGSGKSSLVTLLFRMLEVTPESSITIDGIDLTTLPRQEVRARLNAIPQEPFFMKGNVRENADPMHEHSDEAVVIALKKVYLWDLVNEKGGLDTAMDAEYFSHGQRQLFCLARAVLRKGKVVVLDEATSSVDTKSDELMQRIIRKEFRDCTILAVAHRLDTIMDFDRIALLSAGELVEFDSPKALLGRASRFKELYNS